MKIIGKLSENLSKGDIFYKALYCYDYDDTTDLIARCDSKASIKYEIRKYLEDIEDMESDYILVYEKEYISKEDGCKPLRVYEYMYNKLVLIKDYTKEEK